MSKKIAVIAGTNTDTQMGCDLLIENGYETIFLPISDDCNTQARLQYFSKDELYDLFYSTCEKAIKLGRKDEWIWSRIANVYFDLKRIEDAFQAYSKAYKLAKNSWYICNIGRCLRKLGKYEEAIKKLLQSRKLSLKEGDVVDLEDLELAYCYAALGDKKKAEKHMKLSMDSLGTRAVNEEHLKKQFDEIKEMISVLSKPS